MEGLRLALVFVLGGIALVPVFIGLGCGLDTTGALSTVADATASIDAPAEASAPDCQGWRPHHFDPCTLTPSPVAFTTNITYDTDIPGFVEDAVPDPPTTILDQGGTPAVVIAVPSLLVPQGVVLRIIGARPLVIASFSTITIDGTIDVGSHRAEPRTGAGANPALCAATAAAAGTDETTNGGGSGGGGGGAFAGTGGKGGPGDSNAQNPGGNGGGLVPLPTIIRGGCAGAASGKAGPDNQVTAPSNADTTAPGGGGGGALLLSARQSITINATGKVVAGGAGGAGAPLHSAVGGGGGGSGGFIAFEAPVYTFIANARVAANGGGGGSSNGFADTGQPGADGADGATGAPGGAAGTCAHAGASGSAGADANGPSAAQGAMSCGGGGGGGSAGFVIVYAAAFAVPTQVTISPAPTVVP